MSGLLIVAGLGAYHGLNPAMGWLFAVALGLQERRAAAVLRAIPPLAAGHALSVGLVALVAASASVVVPPGVLRVAGAVALLAFAALLLARRSRHPGSRIGMRAGARDLTAWSFIMSSAHGSGLMLLPILLRTDDVHAHALHHATSSDMVLAGFGDALTVLAVHTSAMLAALVVAALLTWRVLGLGFLRRMWINLDAVWIGSLVIAAVVTLAG